MSGLYTINSRKTMLFIIINLMFSRLSALTKEPANTRTDLHAVYPVGTLVLRAEKVVPGDIWGGHLHKNFSVCVVFR